MWEVPEVNGGFVRWEVDVHRRKWGIFTELGDYKGKQNTHDGNHLEMIGSLSLLD